MLGPRSSRFYQAALQSGLIDEAGLAECWALIPPERRTPEAIDRRLARQAITSGRITLWQAQQLLAGRVSGYQIDKYVLLNLLGRGGMGRVFLARDNRLGRMVALKLLSQERMNNPRAIARFRREAKVGAQLQHENLVRVYDEGESGGLLYLVMEHIDGKNVGQLIGELGRIPWPNAARLARQVALGLEHARLKELIHRDVNPCNILVTADGIAKLTDLGLAIDLNDLDNVTREGATVGTFDYVSPEQAKNSRSVDTRADLYSLGCTLFHMIAGRVPFPMASLPEKLYAHQLHEAEPLTALVPEVPEGLAEVVRRLLRKLPEDRYQTPAELAAALEPFASEAGWSSPSDAALPASDEAPRRSGSGDGPGVMEGSSTGLSVASQATPGGIGESFFPLDLGPAEPLAGNLHKTARVRSASANPDLAESPRRSPRRARVGLAAMLAFGAVVTAGVVATLANLAASKTNPPVKRPGGPGADGPGRGGKAVGPGARPAPPLAVGPVVVRFGDGSSEAVPDLKAAVARSAREPVEVILAAGSTVRLGNEAGIQTPNGGLTIRSGDGPPATIEVVMKAPQPAFLARANLKLSRLRVSVKFDEVTDAPVLRAEGELTVERCTFQATGGGEAPEGAESRLILADGKRLAVVGSLFAGFARPIELAAGPGTVATVDRSIFIAGPAADDAPLVGRVFTVRSAFGGGADVRLRATGCSSRSATFLVVDQFTPEAPLKVEVADSAIWTQALVEFDGAGADPNGQKPAGASPLATLDWDGRANHFALPDAAPWVRLAGLDQLADAPGSLAAWSTGGREVDGRSAPIRFRRPPVEPSDRPGDYALNAGIGDASRPVGADPDGVGPGP